MLNYLFLFKTKTEQHRDLSRLVSKLVQFHKTTLKYTFCQRKESEAVEANCSEDDKIKSFKGVVEVLHSLGVLVNIISCTL